MRSLSKSEGQSNGKAGRARSRYSRIWLRSAAIVVGLAMVAMPLPSRPAVAQTFCRQGSTLNINDITKATVIPAGLTPPTWVVIFELKPGHRMDCPDSFHVCTSPDKWTFKSSIAINIGDVENLDGGCRSIWTVTAASTGDVFFGFKIRFEENVDQPSEFNPRRKLGLVPVRINNEQQVLNQAIDRTGQLIDAGDDGDDN